jgi:hypothetical protein
MKAFGWEARDRLEGSYPESETSASTVDWELPGESGSAPLVVELVSVLGFVWGLGGVGGA